MAPARLRFFSIIILGEESADDGKVILERNVTFGYLRRRARRLAMKPHRTRNAGHPEYTKLRRIIKAWKPTIPLRLSTQRHP